MEGTCNKGHQPQPMRHNRMQMLCSHLYEDYRAILGRQRFNDRANAMAGLGSWCREICHHQLATCSIEGTRPLNHC